MKVLSVTELTLAIKKHLEPKFSSIEVQGEVTNIRMQASGHLYFSLKDAASQISAVLFKGSARHVSRLPKAGDQIVVRGELSLYSPRGSYQIIVRELTHAGVVVRAAHNRSLEQDPHHLWETLEARPIRAYHEVELSETNTRRARTATLALRFCPVQLRPPARLGTDTQLQVYAVYAHEVDCPETEEPVSWMLLSSETVTTVEQAKTILRWYSYRWRGEEYHKLLKSGCQAERYRLAAEGMKSLLGFLSVIAADLLRLTYLQRTQPDMPAEQVLTPVQIQVLTAKSSRLPKSLTVAWAIETIARLGGYLEHRRKTPIGIQVLWRGWATLQDLVEGWKLAHRQT